MASRAALNAKNLQELGAERLADLLIEISTGDAGAKRKLRLALAGAQGPEEAAREVAKRLSSIARARTFIAWQNRKPLIDDLETQRRAIVEQIAPADSHEALDLLWRFMSLATPVFERSDDSSGLIGNVFRQACHDLGGIARGLRLPPSTSHSASFDQRRRLETFSRRRRRPSPVRRGRPVSGRA